MHFTTTKYLHNAYPALKHAVFVAMHLAFVQSVQVKTGLNLLASAPLGISQMITYQALHKHVCSARVNVHCANTQPARVFSAMLHKIEHHNLQIALAIQVFTKIRVRASVCTATPNSSIACVVMQLLVKNATKLPT